MKIFTKDFITQNTKWLIAALIFYAISFVAVWQNERSQSPAVVQEKTTQYVADEINAIHITMADTALLQQYLKQTTIPLTTAKDDEKQFGLFIYDENNTLKFWDTNLFAPQLSDVQLNDSINITAHHSGQFLLLKKQVFLQGLSFKVVGMIPIAWQYFIQNKYLQNKIASIQLGASDYTVTQSITNLPIKYKNNTLFYLEYAKPTHKELYNWFSIITRLLFIFCIFFIINNIVLQVSTNKGSIYGITLLVTSLAVLRTISYFFPFPFVFNNLHLFDPTIYASSKLNPSLGDLFINTLLVFWIVVFIKFQYKHFVPKDKSIQQKYTAGFLYLALLSLLTFFTNNIISSLIVDSKVSLNVSNFFSLNAYSIASLFILCLWMLIFYHGSHILLKKVYEYNIAFLKKLLFVALFGLTYITIFVTNDHNIHLFSVLWLLGYIVIMHYRKQDTLVALGNSSFLLFWLFFFSLSASILVASQNNFVENEQRKKWAEKLAEQTDQNSETLIKIATTNLSDDFLQENFNRFTQEFSNKFLKDSLITENFSGYLNKYDTRIYTYNQLYQPLYNDDSTAYTSLKKLILTECKPTSLDNLYTYESANNKQNFIYEKKLLVGDTLAGYMLVSVKAKNFKSDALYPELFKQVSDVDEDFNNNYAYALYNNGTLIKTQNDYGFPSALKSNELPQFKFEQREIGDFNELWHNNGFGKIVIIAKRSKPIIDFFTLMAYLFLGFLLIIGFFHVANLIIKYGIKRSTYPSVIEFSIKSQIHGTIITISIISFVVIGFATISFFSSRFKESNKERLIQISKVLKAETEEEINRLKESLLYDDVLNMNSQHFNTTIEKAINAIAETHNTDINFYNTTGKLIASTQPYIYNKQLLSEYMQPTAFVEVINNKKTQFIQKENIGNFSYSSIYVPLTNEADEVYGYLNIPFLNSQTELNQEISNFLSTLINVIAFIFLLAGAIAFFATEKITASFKIIGDKMNLVKLGKKNAEIVWSRNDEIGILVNEYNNMVKKLEESAQALAQSEREGAWREMARQVAHEIKNPLTPMKLSIQYLQKAAQNNPQNLPTLTNNVATTLIEQIEQLARIAGDFSQFANIGNVNAELFNLQEIIQSQVSLHATQDRVKIYWDDQLKSNQVFADKIQLSRLFNNLIINAIEATENKPYCIIHIKTYNENNTLITEVADNGSGIAPEMMEKIFTPNFTTKSSGTGLGLAICKAIAEKAGGSIYFSTVQGQGTTFTIVLPVA